VTVSDGSTLSDAQVRELLSTNPTVKNILASNLKKKLEAESQKIKEEQEKVLAEKLAEASQAAENAKTQAVFMAEKKSALKINMADNKSRTAAAKLEVVETAAKETPEKPVGEVWEVAKTAKPPPPPPAASTEAQSQANGTAAAPKPAEVKTEAPRSGIPRAPGSQPNPAQPNAPAPSKIQPPSQIPQGRGAAPARGRGGAAGRGRGAPTGQRGNLNAGAQTFNPQGQAGQKRPREEGAAGGPQQGNSGKRPRGGGPNN